MKRKTIFSALVAVLVTGGAAFAQAGSTGVGGGVGGLSINGLGVTPSGATGLNNTGTNFNNGLGLSNGFVPNNQGLNTLNNGLFNNGLGTTDAFGNQLFNNGFNGLDYTNGFGTGLYPGYGNYGYNNYGYNGYNGYGPAYSGPLVDVRGAWMNNGGGMMRRSGWNGTGIPTLGINVAPGGVRLPPSRVRVKLTQDPNPTTRVAGSRQELGAETDNEPIGELRGGERSPTQIKLASRLQDVMQDRPLREGKVLSIGATGAQVRYEVDDETRVSRFPVEEVFLFQRNGSIASAATDPNLVRVGTQVLIPQPLIRQEQSITGGATITPQFNSVRSSVAGSRQVTRSKSKTTKRKAHTTRKSR